MKIVLNLGFISFILFHPYLSYAATSYQDLANPSGLSREKIYLEELLSQPPGPAAAQAYDLNMKEQQTRAAGYKIRLTQELLDKAFSQGISKESIDRYVELNRDPDEYYGRHILAFISSSQPEGSISTWLSLIGNSKNVVFVLKGLVDNDIHKIGPTQAWVKKMICPGKEGEERCFVAPIDINPVLFEKFAITEVPALVYLPDPLHGLSSCDRDERPDDFLVFYGEVSPLYSLSRMMEVRPEDDLLREIYESFQTRFDGR